jgi:hypothetical protein
MGADDRVKTTRQRAEERRQAKLAAVQEQIDAGTLTIRRMTVKERAEHPPRPREQAHLPLSGLRGLPRSG